MRGSKFVGFVLVALFSGQLMAVAKVEDAALNLRVWRDVSGKEFVGAYEKEALEKVYFRNQDGKVVVVPLEQLSARDVKYIRTTVPPKVSVLVRAKEKNREVHQKTLNCNLNSKFKDIFQTVKITLDGKTAFYGTLKAELYLIAEDLQSEMNVMMARRQFPVKFPKVDRGKPMVELTMMGEMATYDDYTKTYRQGWKYKGYLFCLYAPDGSLMEMDSNLNWITTENLDTIRSYRYFTFFDDDGRKKSTPRPRIEDNYSAGQ